MNRTQKVCTWRSAAGECLPPTHLVLHWLRAVDSEGESLLALLGACGHLLAYLHHPGTLRSCNSNSKAAAAGPSEWRQCFGRGGPDHLPAAQPAGQKTSPLCSLKLHWPFGRARAGGWRPASAAFTPAALVDVPS